VITREFIGSVVTRPPSIAACYRITTVLTYGTTGAVPPLYKIPRILDVGSDHLHTAHLTGERHLRRIR
jgi:hypothetical protein